MPQKNNIKRTVYMKYVLIMAAVCLMSSCGGRSSNAGFQRSVWLATPVSQAPSEVVRLSGIVREAHEISLGFKTAGQISRIAVKEGDRVRKGQLLAELDASDYRLAVEAAQIQYDQLKAEAARAERLLAERSLSKNDYEKLAAGLRQLEVQLQAQKNQMDYTRLCAPADGYIQAVNFSPSEMVDAGTPVFTLLDVSRMEVSADISVREYMRRERFASFSCVTAGGERMPMKLLSLTPRADGNQLYGMRLVFDGAADRRLTAGMNVGIEIEVSSDGGSHELSIPLSALFQADGLSCVWVFNRADSTVTRRTVQTAGADSEGRVRIAGGLSGDEQVVRAGVGSLHEGERVRVLSEASPTNVGGLL